MNGAAAPTERTDDKPSTSHNTPKKSPAAKKQQQQHIKRETQEIELKNPEQQQVQQELHGAPPFEAIKPLINRGVSRGRATAAGKRPLYSLASLIGQAILSSPEQKARLGNIYDWIAERYPDFYQLNQGGWQNSIRHNLTINKAFIRLPKQPEDEPGKGAFWVINPDHRDDFQNGVFVGKIRGAEYRATPKAKNTGGRRSTGGAAGGASSSSSSRNRRRKTLPPPDSFNFNLLPDQDHPEALQHEGQFMPFHSGITPLGGPDMNNQGGDEHVYGFSGPPPVHDSVASSSSNGGAILFSHPMAGTDVPYQPMNDQNVMNYTGQDSNAMGYPNNISADSSPQYHPDFANNSVIYGYMMPPPMSAPLPIWQTSTQMPGLIRSQSAYSFGLGSLSSAAVGSQSANDVSLPHMTDNHDHAMPNEHMISQQHLQHQQPDNQFHQPAPPFLTHDGSQFAGYYPPEIQVSGEHEMNAYGDEFQNKDGMRSKSITPLVPTFHRHDDSTFDVTSALTSLGAGLGM